MNGGRLPVAGTIDLDERPLARYRTRPAEPIRFVDSQRLNDLIRAGNLYLSLRDALLLAIENNLDVEYQRITPLIAEADILRARAGAIARGVPSGIREGPGGLSGGNATQGISATAGSPGSSQDQLLGLTSGTSVPAAGPQASSSGPAVPLLDPTLTGSLGWGRTNRPQTNTFITGTNASIGTSTTGDLQLRKGFLFGGTAALGFDTVRQNTNNLRADINPATTGGLAFSYVQPLLQGFGFAVNNRYIRIANNNRHVSDLVFEQQVISTAYSVTRLYWDLVSLNGQVAVQRQSLALAQRLLSENRQQEEVGTLAPIDVVRAQAEVARARRDLTVAETAVRQQETILKDYLTRGTVDSARLAALRIVTTDSIAPPSQEPISPIQDLVELARKRRPELGQSALQVENARITLSGSRSGLLPTLDLAVNARSNALIGSVNPLPPAGGTTGSNVQRQPDPAFIGGIGTGLTQIFGARFPDYSAEIHLNIPLFNRVARADYTRDQLAVRQQQIRAQQLEKQVRVDVMNALIAVEQSRAAYDAAQEARNFQQRSLEAEQERYAVGASTSFLLIQYQRDLALAQQTAVAALADYATARAALQRATGTLLDSAGISVDDAYRGQFPASSTPAVP